jgi:peptide deformylase
VRIYHYEKEQDLAVLHTKCSEVASDELIADEVIDQMFALMRKQKGIGLAAPQVGISKRFFIIEMEEGEPYVFINPEIIQTSATQAIGEEGCLSLPGLFTEVARYTEITVQAENQQRKLFRLKAKGLLAVCIQHEYDHLNGVLHIDTVQDAALKEQLISRYLRKRALRIRKK